MTLSDLEKDYYIKLKPKCITVCKLESNRLKEIIKKNLKHKRLTSYVLYSILDDKFPYLDRNTMSQLLGCKVTNIIAIKRGLSNQHDTLLKETIEEIKALI